MSIIFYQICFNEDIYIYIYREKERNREMDKRLHPPFPKKDDFVRKIAEEKTNMKKTES